jgi:acetyl-CoA carboxylase carboxyltransferase component
MGGAQAAQVLVTVKREQLEREGGTLDDAGAEAIAAPILEKYEREGHPFYASARLWDDGVVDLRGTRAVLAASLACALSTPVEATRMGVLRM